MYNIKNWLIIQTMQIKIIMISRQLGQLGCIYLDLSCLSILFGFRRGTFDFEKQGILKEKK